MFKLFTMLGGCSASTATLSEAKRNLLIERAAAAHFKTAAIFNRLHSDAEVRLKRTSAKIEKLKSELAHAVDGSSATQKLTKKESLKNRDLSSKIRHLERELVAAKKAKSSETSVNPTTTSELRKKSNDEPAVGVTVVRKKKNDELEKKKKNEELSGRISALAECKGKFDRIRSFMEANQFRRSLIDLYNQVRGKVELLEVLEKGEVFIPPIIKSDISSQKKTLERKLSELPNPPLDHSDLNVPVLLQIDLGLVRSWSDVKGMS